MENDDKYLPELLAEKDSLDPSFTHAMKLLNAGDFFLLFVIHFYFLILFHFILFFCFVLLRFQVGRVVGDAAFGREREHTFPPTALAPLCLC